MKAKVFPLPEAVESMCTFCLTRATHFIVISYSHGDLKATCPRHATEEMY